MNPQQFHEILRSICLTTNTGINKLADRIGISQPTLWKYEHYGVPASKKVLIMHKLHSYLLARVGG